MRSWMIGISMWLVALSAVGQEVTPKSEPVTISYWGEDVSIQRSVYDEWIADFQEEYPWITVDFRRFDNEVWEERLRAGMYSESPPDMFDIETRGELQEYVEAGLIYDLTDWYTSYQERFIPGYEFNSLINSRYYGVPWTVHVLDLLWYNTKKMEQYGLDPRTINTWDDLSAMCDRLKQYGEIPFAFGGGGMDRWTLGDVSAAKKPV